MNEAIIISIIAATPGLLGAIFAYRQSTRAAAKASQNEMLRVEAGAYERARKLYEDGIRQLEEQVDRLHRQVTDEQEVSSKLRKQINNLEDTVAALRRQLVNSGVDLLPPSRADRRPR